MLQTSPPKKVQNLSKYKDLDFEVSRLCKVRKKVVPVIIGALGTIKKGLDKNFQLLPGHPLATDLQEVTLMNTSHIMCEVLG